MQETFDMMRSVETAQSIIRSARSNLVSRLNSYAMEHRVLFEQSLDMVTHELMHIVKRQALMGCAIIRSNNPMLENPLCLNMVLGELQVLRSTQAWQELPVTTHALRVTLVPSPSSLSSAAASLSLITASPPHARFVIASWHHTPTACQCQCRHPG